MENKHSIEQQIQSQVEVWRAQILAHQERMKQAGEEGTANIEKAVAQLKEQAEQGQKLLEQVQKANEAALQNMQKAWLDSLERLQKGWADGLKRFTSETG